MVSPRVVPGVAFGAFAGTALVSLPLAPGLLIFGVPLVLWGWLRASLWSCDPRTRPVTAGFALGAAVPIVAVVLTMLPLPQGQEFAGICW